jgi:type I restriction enzyme, R subunit
VTEGIDELYQEKLGALIGLRYGSVNDAVRAIGSVDNIREAFIGFQRHLFAGGAEQ